MSDRIPEGYTDAEGKTRTRRWFASRRRVVHQEAQPEKTLFEAAEENATQLDLVPATKDDGKPDEAPGA